MIFLKKKTKLKKMNQNYMVNNLATCPPKNADKKMDRLLTLRWPGYWPYFFDPKTGWKSSFKILKTLFHSVLGPERQNNLDSPPKKSITFAHANIIGHVQNARKYFHLFGWLCFLGLFFALANLTTQQHKKHNNNNNNNKDPPPQRKDQNNNNQDIKKNNYSNNNNK